MTATLIDTHCHIDAYNDPVSVLDQAAARGVQIVAVTEGPGAYRRLRTRLGRREGVHVALGFHPLRVGNVAPYDLARFFRLLPQTSWIGEIGLDFSRSGVATKKQQLKVFEAILSDPQVRTRPLTVHSRGAERETVARLAQAQVNAILHWYTGPLSVVDDALAAGLWFSVNPAMTRSAKIAAVLQRIPAERVLLETDGPYSRCNNRPTVPVDIKTTVRHLAQLWGISSEDAEATISRNQQGLLGRDTTVRSVEPGLGQSD
ncbi:TatD family hydrolase [Pseudonocardia petroleophila]|uniref:TatD family hydrolase n=1 Tax=Pseudonocardia petroleophila TaxID=37331 RepID=A0A7G7MGJ8_9PSEU|nr:TatD family hydrolase [Pseudonocardia petroleophila]QNG51909.1 TatD family hydrolase [Pseudonocardia petroleophila]